MANLNPQIFYVMAILTVINKSGIQQVLSFEQDSSTASSYTHRPGMLKSTTHKWLQQVDTDQRNYGMAATDVDFDGEYEIVVAGFDGPNLVLKFVYGQGISSNHFENLAKTDSPFEALRDPKGQAIGVAACDIDGDGKEEIYILNTNQAYAGISSYGDKIFKWRDGKYIDLYSDDANKNLTSKNYAGRSVACIDRKGTGKYGFIIATYGQAGTGAFSLIEMDEDHVENNVVTGQIVLKNVASEAKIDRTTGGRGIVVGPIVSENGRSDIFFNNEGNSLLENQGNNFLFRNLANGSFYDVAGDTGITDSEVAGRGVALADFNNDGLFDIVTGNYEGPHRVFIQKGKGPSKKFVNIATADFEKPSTVRNIIVADFDNNGNQEIYFNNIRDGNQQTPNRLFTVESHGQIRDPEIIEVNAGDAIDADGFGTGALVADFNQDGFIDLLVSHGEDKAQPLEVFTPMEGYGNNWIQVFVRTKYGAPARGATVKVLLDNGSEQMQVIDGGSAYLCQMEPVAHFGLGTHEPLRLKVQWPDSTRFTMDLSKQDMKGTLHIDHEDSVNPVTETLWPSQKRTKVKTEETTKSENDKKLNVTLNVSKSAHEEL